MPEPTDPEKVLRRDREAFLAVFFIVAAAAGLGIGVSTGFSDGLWAGLASGAVLGGGIGLGAAFVQAAWGSFTVTRCWLALRRRLPWRLMAFLDDARSRRHVLRHAGSVYQFRHAELQQSLAGKSGSQLG